LTMRLIGHPSACSAERFQVPDAPRPASRLYRRFLRQQNRAVTAQQPIKPDDPYLLRDVATVLLDCGLRPEECYRLRWEHVRDNALHIPFGKTANARRSIPLPNRAAVLLDMRKSVAASEWVFPAPTKTGHMMQSSLVKQHAKACKLASIEALPFYTFRHTCLTRWASHMDPYALAYFAGHSDFGTTRRYVHPNMDTGRAAMERARVPPDVVTQPDAPAPSPAPSKPS